MKISNTRRVKLLAYVMLLFMALALGASLFTENRYVDLLLYANVLIFSFAFFKLRCTELDSSGSCFTVRRKHPFKEKGYIRPEVEFPISSVKEVCLDRAAISCSFNVKIQSQSSGKNFRLNLLFFDQKKLERLQYLIQEDTKRF